MNDIQSYDSDVSLVLSKCDHGDADVMNGTMTNNMSELHNDMEQSKGSLNLPGFACILPESAQEVLKVIGGTSATSATYIREYGENKAIVESQCNRIKSNDKLLEYYTTFNRVMSSALRANQVIYSHMVTNASRSLAEKTVHIMGIIAKSTTIPFLPVATGLTEFILNKVNDKDRMLMVNRVVGRFSVDMNMPLFVEALARKLTLGCTNFILIGDNVADRDMLGYCKDMYNVLIKGYENMSSVQRLANQHVSILLTKFMTLEPVKLLELCDVDEVSAWIIYEVNGKSVDSVTVPQQYHVIEDNYESLSKNELLDMMKAMQQEVEALKAKTTDVADKSALKAMQNEMEALKSNVADNKVCDLLVSLVIMIHRMWLI